MCLTQRLYRSVCARFAFTFTPKTLAEAERAKLSQPQQGCAVQCAYVRASPPSTPNLVPYIYAHISRHECLSTQTLRPGDEECAHISQIPTLSLSNPPNNTAPTSSLIPGKK